MPEFDLGTAHGKIRVDSTDLDVARAKAASFTTGLRTSLVKTGASLSRFGSVMTKSVTLPILGLAAAAVHFASDLNETKNKVKVLFGSMARSVIDWSKTSIKRMGLAQQTALDFASQLGPLFEAAGFTGKAVSGMSEDFVQLAADMASFFNVDTEEALNALRSGLIGEAEPLRRFGVLLSENAVKAEAYKTGIAKVGSELTDQQKVAARAAIIMKSLDKASGDYARTADGVANKSRAVKEQAKELAAQFGQGLLPVVQKLLGWGSQLLSWFQGLDKNGRKMVVTVLAILAAIGPAVLIIGKLVTVFSLLLSPVGLIIVALIALAALWLRNKENQEKLLKFLQNFGTWITTVLVPWIKNALERIAAWWERNSKQIMAIVTVAWEFISSFISAILKQIRGIIDIVLGLIHGDFGRVWKGIKELVFGILDEFKAKITLVWTVIKTITFNVWRGIRDEVLSIVGDLLGWLTDGFASFVSFFAKVAGAILAAADFAFGWVPFFGKKIKNARAAFEDSMDGIVASLRDSADEFHDWGEKARSQIDAATESAKRLERQMSAVISKGGGFTSFASGGITPGGLSLVGERGPELAAFPRGTAILPAHQTLSLLRRMANGMDWIPKLHSGGLVLRDMIAHLAPREAVVPLDSARAQAAIGGGSMTGLRIAGTVELTGRSTAVIRGIVVEELRDQDLFTASTARMSR